MIKKNMHNIDRVIRVVIGIILIYFGFIETDWVSSNIIPVLVGVLGIANLFFAISGFCPLYQLANLNLLAKENKE